MGAVYHIIRYFLAPVRGQAMHEEAVLLRKLHQLCIDLKTPERLEPLLRLPLLSHAHPHIRIYDVGIPDSVPGMIVKLYLASGFGGEFRRDPYRILQGLIPFRRCHRYVKPDEGCRHQERVEDVIAVSDKRQLRLPEIAELLLYGIDIAERLARMLPVAQPVYDRDIGMPCQRSDVAVAVCPRDEAIQISRKDTRYVFYGLALAHLQLMGPEVYRVSSQLNHAYLERYARPVRRLLEYQAYRFACKSLRERGLVMLDLLGQREYLVYVVLCQVRYG